MSRNINKGPFFKVNLINDKNEKKKKQWIKINNKNFVILPEYIDHIINVYNGKTFVKIKIIDKMVGYKFGEFIYTRKKHVYKKKKK